MMSRFPSWLLSAMTGSPAIGPTLIGEPGAILKLEDCAAFGSRSLTARTVVDNNARKIIETMLSRFMVHLSEEPRVRAASSELGFAQCASWRNRARWKRRLPRNDFHFCISHSF